MSTSLSGDPSAVVEHLLRDVLNGTDDALALGLIDGSFEDHTPWFEHPPTREGWLLTLGAWRNAFPDLVFTPARLVCEGDLVAYQGTWTGTQQGAFGSIAPSGRAVEVGEHRLFRVRDGKVVEHWQEQDTVGMLRQLGHTT